MFITYCAFFEDFQYISDYVLSLFSLGVSMCTNTRQVVHQQCSRTGRVQKNYKILKKKHNILWTSCSFRSIIYIPNPLSPSATIQGYSNTFKKKFCLVLILYTAGSNNKQKIKSPIKFIVPILFSDPNHTEYLVNVARFRRLRIWTLNVIINIMIEQYFPNTLLIADNGNLAVIL